MKTMRIGRVNLAISAILLAVAAVWPAFSSGQQPRTATPQNDGARQVKADKFDHHVAQCLILGNQNEVAAAKIAQRKGSENEVKEFADAMVKDHEQFTAELEKFAGHNYRHRDGGGRATAAGAERRTGAETARTAPRGPEGKDDKEGRDGKDGDHWAKFMRIREELADQCRASVQRELDSKAGKAFDECYIGMQIGMHMKMVDELTVLERHVSPEFKSILENGREAAQRHLNKAKEIMKNLNDTRTADSSDSTAK
jgi:predicted outer membrane protein